MSGASLRLCLLVWGQDKKKLEEERARELNELFAVAIKQPKVPAGEAILELPFLNAKVC